MASVLVGATFDWHSVARPVVEMERFLWTSPAVVPAVGAIEGDLGYIREMAPSVMM